jgi:V/A-type H+/Na+-transporting ATPase subunit I
MAVISMQKITLIAFKKHKEKLLGLLQDKGVMEVTEISDKEELLEEYTEELQDLSLEVAELDFAINLLKPYERKRSLREGPLMLTPEEIKAKSTKYDHKQIVEECKETEDAIVANQNRLNALTSEEDEIKDWEKLSYKLNEFEETEEFKFSLGIANKQDFSDFKENFEKASKLQSIEVVSETESSVYFVVAFSKEIETEVRELIIKHKVFSPELPKKDATVKEELSCLAKEKAEAEKTIEKAHAKLEKLGKESENLKINHDYFAWKLGVKKAEENIKNTDFSLTITGWVPLKHLNKLEKEINKITKDFTIIRVEKEENEDVPVMIHNSGILGPFESVTRIYGLPLAHEVDPTPFLAGFFIIYFGLCLTDAGYGLILFVLTFSALKFLKIPKQSQKLIKLIMMGGILTFIMGILFGGWFGMTAEQAPAFLTYDKIMEGGEIVKTFKWQIINPTQGNGPLTFLIVAAILGIIQVMAGITVDGYWKIKSKKYLDALLDSALWLGFISSILLFSVAAMGLFMPEKVELFKIMTLSGVVLMVLTQGRKKKGIIMKFLSGILSLYALVGYMADVLSYSRIMALGLGTGIIGFAMNAMAGLAGGIPYIGMFVAVIVIIIGHTLNIAISTLGAFIHSSRLQFVEFFGKFMEGGGREFKAFRRNCKYVIINEDN